MSICKNSAKQDWLTATYFYQNTILKIYKFIFILLYYTFNHIYNLYKILRVSRKIFETDLKNIKVFKYSMNNF